MMDGRLLLFALYQLFGFINATEHPDVSIIHRIQDTSEEESEQFLVNTEIHLRGNSIGKSVLLDNGTILLPDFPRSMPSFECLHENGNCSWTKLGSWSKSPLKEEEKTALTLSTYALKSCSNQNSGCEGHCSYTLNGPECSCPGGFSLNGDMKTCSAAARCSYIYRGTEGSFNLQHYERDYYSDEGDAECEWLIIVPRSKKVHLNIHRLHTEECCDFVRVYDVLNNLMISQWSGGTYFDLEATSSGNVMLVTFTSDGLSGTEGFQATFRARDVVVDANAETSSNALQLDDGTGMLHTILNLSRRNVCLTTIYKLAPFGNIDIFINWGTSAERKFIESQRKEEEGWIISRFMSPIVDESELQSLSVVLKGQESKIFHIADCDSADEAAVHTLQRRTWKASDFIEYKEIQTDLAGKCENGGTVNEDGNCECPVGFSGNKCEIGCGSNRYGNDCKGECSWFVAGCKNMIFCKVLAYSSTCMCATGYHGKRCDKECSPGRYGANCNLKCGRCGEGPCNTYTGRCSSGCRDGYYPPMCQKRYAALAQAPTIINKTSNSILISNNFTNYDGQGSPYLYQVQYKGEDDTDWTEIYPEEIVADVALTNVTKLKVGTKYSLRVVIISKDGNSYQGEDIPAAESETECQVPDSVDYQIRFNNITSSSFEVQWQNDILSDKWCPIAAYDAVLQDRWMEFSRRVHSEENMAVAYSDLLPGYHYKVYVCGITKQGRSLCSTPTSVTTADRAPTEVLNLQAISSKAGNIRVSWNEPLYTGGIIKGYRLRYACLKHLLCEAACSFPSGELEVFGTSTELSNLKPLAQYAIRVAAYSENEGAYAETLVATTSAKPSVAPEASAQPIVSISNTSATIQWQHPLCHGINGGFQGYYVVLSTETGDTKRLTKESRIQDTQISFDSLVPSTTYQAHIYTLNSHGWNLDYALVIPLTTSATVPEAVENLVVYKRGRRMIGVRWSLPRRMYGDLASFTLSYRAENKEESIDVTISPTETCTAWPDQYCHTITRLRPETNYIIAVGARNTDIAGDGARLQVKTRTREHSPDAPTYLRILKSTTNSFDMQWGIPNMFNGEIRSFIVNVEHIDSLDETLCCDNFPVQELPFREETPFYHLQVSELISASTYIVSVSAKTITMGPSINVTYNTAPPAPTNIIHPKLASIKGDDVSFSLQVEPIEGHPRIHSLYLLLVMPSNALTTADIWDDDMAAKLSHAADQGYYIVSEFTQDDLIDEKKVKIGTGGDSRNGTYGVLKDPKLSPGLYRVGLALVLDFGGARSVGIATSPPFEVEAVADREAD